MSLAPNDIALLSDWSVSTSVVSEHLPILITINSEQSTIDGPRLSYINFTKADWARYAVACDEYIVEAGKSRTVEQAKKTFRKAVNKDSGLLIPFGRIRHFQLTVPASAKSLTQRILPIKSRTNTYHRQYVWLTLSLKFSSNENSFCCH